MTIAMKRFMRPKIKLSAVSFVHMAPITRPAKIARPASIRPTSSIACNPSEIRRLIRGLVPSRTVDTSGVVDGGSVTGSEELGVLESAYTRWTHDWQSAMDSAERRRASTTARRNKDVLRTYLKAGLRGDVDPDQAECVR